MRLKDKVAIVTGAGSGNGAAIAVEYLRQGAKVVFADINEDAARAIASESGMDQDLWMVHLLDVSNRASVQACVAATVERFGRLDILVANAGINIRKSFLDLTDEDFDRLLQVNTKGVFMCSQEAARIMVEQGSGAIIHISSIAAIRAPRRNGVAYGASKAAVHSMTQHMAQELSGHNIRVNAIVPGAVLTGMNKDRLADPEAQKRESGHIMLGRIAGPEELTGAAVLLASEEASFMTGTHIVVDGGETAQ